MPAVPSQNTAEMYTATPNPSVDTPVKESTRKYTLIIVPEVTCILNPVDNLQNPDVPYGNYAPVPLITLRPDNGYGLYDPIVMYEGSSPPAVFALRPDGGFQIIPASSSDMEIPEYWSSKTAGPFLAVFIRPYPAGVTVKKVSKLSTDHRQNGAILIQVVEAPGVGSARMTYNPYQETVKVPPEGVFDKLNAPAPSDQFEAR